MAKSRTELMVDRLRDLQASTPDIEASAVVSVDGLIMASSLPQSIEEDRVSAMSAAMISLVELQRRARRPHSCVYYRRCTRECPCWRSVCHCWRRSCPCWRGGVQCRCCLRCRRPLHWWYSWMACGAVLASALDGGQDRPRQCSRSCMLWVGW